MKIQKVSLTPPEAAWVSRNILKSIELMEGKAKKDPQTLERTTYKVLASLKAKAEEAASVVKAFGEDEKYMYEFQPSKKQKQIVQELVSSVHKGLVEGVIPKYERTNNQEYLVSAREKAELLEGIKRKFK